MKKEDLENPEKETSDSTPEETAPVEEKEALQEDFQSLYLRAAADLENFRKRVAKEKQGIIKMANASLLESLLPIIDNMKLGLAAGKSNPEAKELSKGFEMVLEQLGALLAENGLIEIQTDGAEFDPNNHECISYQASEEVPEGTIIQTTRSGYILNDRLIRAANVIVSSGLEKNN
tara:strand:+ start:2280 stop:2807 length:528 start_codon:yes stop_codon:yes gene_type:complete